MPVKIICRIHGAFFQRATNHLRGDGCRKCSDKECSDRQSYDLSKFVEMANAKHGKFYDYSKSIYTSSQDKLEIICPLHGSFHQVPAAHLSGMGCPKCANEKASVRLTKTKDEFVSLAKSVHGERYDYKNSNYCGVFDKIEIGCKIHGPFFQTPDSHTNGGAGCPKCNLSKGELKIMRFGERYGLSVIHQKSFDDCRNPKTNRKLKFDFYAPLQNILIEYDGEQHFHQCTFGNHVLTDEEFKDIQFKDRVKTKYAHDNGIKLLRIPFEKLDNINEILTHEFLSPIPK
jgi:ssDNA-binding Zn-finger/Zn-ribbon topoisomerase 1